VTDVRETESDESLLNRLCRKDPAALDELYVRYGRTAFALAYRVLGNPETAEDAVQEAFLTIWRRAESYQQTRGAVRAWLLTVVRNRAIDLLRARESRPKVGATLDDITSLAAPGADPADDALRRYEGRMARALASVINVVDPDVIVLGGGMSNIARLYAHVPRLWTEFVFAAQQRPGEPHEPDEPTEPVESIEPNEFKTKFVRARHGAASGVRGAAWLWPDGSNPA